MTIDEKGLEAAAVAVASAYMKLAPKQIARSAIETYEAALWKPIEELAECKAKQILLWGGGDYFTSRRDQGMYWIKGQPVETFGFTHFRPLPEPPKQLCRAWDWGEGF